MPGNNGGRELGRRGRRSRNGKLFVVSKDLPAMLKLEIRRPQRSRADE